MDLSIIIVNWKSTDQLLKCIPSIYEWTSGITFEAIVVDNGSPATDLLTLQERFPDVKLIVSNTNLGFAGGNNLGFRQSFGKWILFLNPDTKLVSPAINTMLRQASELADLGIGGCKLLNTDGSVQTSSVMKFPTIVNIIFQIEYLRQRWPRLWGIDVLFSAGTEPAEVEAISGACMLVKREVMERIGMFSEDYFMYSEDLDLCYKVRSAGFRNYYLGQGTIVHHGGRSSPPAWQAAMKTKSELRFCEKHYGSIYTALFRIAFALNALARLTLIACLRPFSQAARRHDTLDSAWAKWSVILKAVTAVAPQRP